MAPEVVVPAGRSLPPAIGRYEILSLLGQGGMARVFLALQRGAFASEKLVVLKQLRPELVSDEQFLAMFMDEARIALQLHHPNVVHTYEVGTEQGDYFLTMEFLEGLTLSQIIRKAGREGLPLHLHIWILSQVLAGLAYAHDLRALDGEPLGIVHRDVTPSNVMITSSGEVKLLDFGIAKAAGALSLTQQGVIKGKLGYVAPEQCLGRPSDARADLFAVGVMLWEAIAERRRVSAETSAAAFEARIRNQEPSIQEVVPDVAPRLAEICARALAHEPSQRYASATEFRADLDDFLDSNYSRVGASKLAAQMVQLFTDEFTALRMRIERHVQEHRRPSSERVPRMRDSEPVTHIAETSFRPRRKQWVIGGVAGIAAVSGLLLALRGSPPPAAVAPAAAVSSASAPVAPAGPSAGAAIAKVQVSIVASPREAEILLDGRRLGNPFNQRLAADSTPHELQVSAEGYEDSVQSVSLEQDLQLVVQLKKEHAPARRTGRGAPARSERLGAATGSLPRADSAAAPAATPAAPARTSTPTPQPGQDLRNTTRQPRAIDEKDLYQ